MLLTSAIKPCSLSLGLMVEALYHDQSALADCLEPASAEKPTLAEASGDLLGLFVGEQLWSQTAVNTTQTTCCSLS